MVEEMGADLVDVNMGCPVPKVTRKGSGAALMKDTKRAAAVIARMVAQTSCPVTVKIRAGWDRDSINAPESPARSKTLARPRSQSTRGVEARDTEASPRGRSSQTSSGPFESPRWPRASRCYRRLDRMQRHYDWIVRHSLGASAASN